MQLIEIALAPARGGEAEPGDEAEEQHEDAERNPVHIRHDTPPPPFGLSGTVRAHRAPGYSRVAKYTTAVITALTMTHAS